MAQGSGLVVLAEDDPAVTELVRLYLTRDGFTVQAYADGSHALQAVLTHRPVAVVLDIGLPGLDGIEVCRRLRARGDRTPVLFVTARDDEVDRVLGLELGADDYVTKPFSPREVVASVKAVLRRARDDEPDPERLRFDRLTVDLGAREVTVDERPVMPSALEFDLLGALARSPGRVFSRRQLLELVWGDDFYGDERVVDVHVRSLRRLLADDVSAPRFIATVRGVGYKFVGRPS